MICIDSHSSFILRNNIFNVKRRKKGFTNSIDLEVPTPAMEIARCKNANKKMNWTVQQGSKMYVMLKQNMLVCKAGSKK